MIPEHFRVHGIHLIEVPQVHEEDPAPQDFGEV